MVCMSVMPAEAASCTVAAAVARAPFSDCTTESTTACAMAGPTVRVGSL